MLLAVLFMVSCDKDDPTEPENVNFAKEIEGKYDGYTSGAFQYSPTPLITSDESVSITANENGAASIVCTSKTWGDFKFENVKVTPESNGYKIEGAGKTVMGMSADEEKEYDCTVAGTISKDKKDVSILFEVPAVMGGVKITFLPGEAPADQVVAKTYKGKLDVSVSGNSMIKEDQFSVTLKSQGEGKVEITVPGFGEAPMGFKEMVLKDIVVEKVTNGGFKLTGDVNTISGTINVSGSVAGTISNEGDAVITFTLKPGAMQNPVVATFTGK